MRAHDTIDFDDDEETRAQKKTAIFSEKISRRDDLTGHHTARCLRIVLGAQVSYPNKKLPLEPLLVFEEVHPQIEPRLN